MEPEAGPGWRGFRPAPGGTDPGQGSCTAAREEKAQGSWSGAAGGNWITAHPTVGRGGGPAVSRGSRSPGRTLQDSPLEVHVVPPQEGSAGKFPSNR